MKRNEFGVLAVIICVLIAVNTVNFIRKDRLRRTCSLIINQGPTKLSINTVSARELEDLPGIGPVLAGRIIEYREKNRGFGSLEELKQVKGIGDKLYEKIFSFLQL